ncbi:MAG: hypothetical protein ACRCZF_16850, partial [Gemmataceae bacterium]
TRPDNLTGEETELLDLLQELYVLPVPERAIRRAEWLAKSEMAAPWSAVYDSLKLKQSTLDVLDPIVLIRLKSQIDYTVAGTSAPPNEEIISSTRKLKSVRLREPRKKNKYQEEYQDSEPSSWTSGPKVYLLYLLFFLVVGIIRVLLKSNK